MVDQALCSARGQEGGIGGVIRAAEPREAGLGAARGGPPITLPILGPQIRGPARGLSVVHEWLQPGVLEGRGAEGLLPWLLGVPVLWYGGGGVPALLLTPPPASMPLHLAHLIHSLAT